MVGVNMIKKFFLLTFVMVFLNSCSWLHKEWEDRPDWLMPDSSTSSTQTINNSSNTLLVSGFSILSSPSEVRKDIAAGGLKYEKSKNDRKAKLLSYSFGGTLIDAPRLFSYSSSDSTVNFFEGSLLSTRMTFNATSDQNLEEIINSLYQILVNNYSSPDSEASIYSFQTYKWNNEEVEVFLSVDKENKRVFVTEINSKLEESRSFREFKNKFIDEYQTYDEEVKYGKSKR
jgi:hypothetical protein